jgi:hypothetical protein
MESTNITESSLIADIVKEFKATGNFDQLRKEYYSEITSQVGSFFFLQYFASPFRQKESKA